MTQHRIVCTEQQPCGKSPSKAHIVAVGIGDKAEAASFRRTLAEVISAMKQGDGFYTVGEVSKKTAKVDKYQCPHCGGEHIRTVGDVVKDNNLDSLRFCNWK